MRKIDDLILVENAISNYNNLEKKKNRHYESVNRESLEETLEEIYDKLNKLEYEEGTQLDLFNEADRIEKIMEDCDKIEKECEQQAREVDKKLDGVGIGSRYEFMEVKDKFLENLIFNENIANVGENSGEYFRKLIELYGEEELANYSSLAPVYKENDPNKIYEDHEEYEESYEDDFEELEDGDDEIFWGGNPSTIEKIDYDFDENATNDDKTLKIYAPHTLHDFITGKEDELIGVAKTKSLKKALLVSKLRTVDETNWNITHAISEYSEEIYNSGKNYYYTDEYGLPDVKTTFLNLADLPILDDKNFYMYLVKNTDETQLPIDKLVAYIDSEIVNEQFINDLRKTRETKKYEYQNEETNYKSEETIDDKLLAGLEGKEKTLTSLEQEEKKISEAEQLIDIQKDGQNKGE